MALRIDKNELYEWYKHVIAQKKSGLGLSDFCRKHNLDPVTFNNKRWRLFNCQSNKPEQYEIYLAAYKRYKIEKENDPAITLFTFCKINNLEKTKLVEFASHTVYLNVIDEFLSKESSNRPVNPEPIQEKQESNFIQLKAPVKQEIVPVVEQVKEHEIVEAQNDLEIQITKGVKVLVSPQIESTKILKIIQLLRDL